MIKLNNLNKYFYKGEAREIHVINDCVLELPDTGLITFLGASGSGKTTLLNVIGGLDKVDSGSITFDNQTFANKDWKKSDEYRKEHIGYIFQNYLLFNEKTVYNNLKEALELIGVYDQEEQRKRIEYALEKVNMYKFRKKRVKNLSGGQMQRVSIARALVKDAKIIIADEPTGNIDSTNTIEVMNILKKLSETTLVILVTHEESIANYYSDRIINIKDGKVISDELVTKRKKLNNETDQMIYLLDYEKEENVSDNLNVDLYYDNKSTASSVQIIVKNNTIYIKSDKKIINLNDSSIKVVNEKYQDYEENANLTNDETFDTSWYKTEKKKQNPFVSFFKSLGKGFVDYFSGKKSYIFFMIIFIILGAITATSAINLIKYTTFDDSSIYDEDGYYFILPKHYDAYTEEIPYISDTDVLIKAYQDDMIDEYTFVAQDYITFSNKQSIVNSYDVGELVYKTVYRDMKLICGNTPNEKECVIGKKLADDILEGLNKNGGDYNYFIGKTMGSLIITGVSEKNTRMVYTSIYNLSNCTFSDNYYYGGYSEVKWIYKMDLGFIGSYDLNNKYIAKLDSGKYPEAKNEIIINNAFSEEIELDDEVKLYDKDDKVLATYKVVGFYTNTNYGYNILSIDENIIGATLGYDRKIYKNDNLSAICVNNSEYVLVSGVRPTKYGEVLANINSGYKAGDTLEIPYYGTYEVTGVYDLKDEYKTSHEFSDYCQTYVTYPVLFDNIQISRVAYRVAEEDVKQLKKYVEEQDYTLISVSDYQKNSIARNYQKSKITNIVLTVFLIGLVVLFTYLTSRSKMIKQIYSIGVYRSLGQSKKDIKKKAIFISIAQTTTSSLIGYVLVIGIYLYFGKNFIGIIEDFTTKPALLLLGIPVLYFINIVFSLIPYNALLRKTPAQINSKFDI